MAPPPGPAEVRPAPEIGLQIVRVIGERFEVCPAQHQCAGVTRGIGGQRRSGVIRTVTRCAVATTLNCRFSVSTPVVKETLAGLGSARSGADAITV